MSKNTPYILIASGVAAVVCLLSFFDLYDNFENSLLDMRFKNRGLVEVRDDIATVDIDTDALATIGKWSPWSRDKHLPVIKAAAEHGMDAFLFDFYFIEESERELNIKDIDFENDTTANQIKEKFRDPDNDLAFAAENAGNIIFAQSFKPKTKAQAADSVKKRTEVMDQRLSLMKEKNYFRKVPENEIEKYSTIFSAYNIEAPLDVLIEKSSGVYFFQSEPDPDGLQRRFPLLVLYGNRLFPAASLAMALRHYKVSFDSVEIEPGKYLRFDINPELDDFGRSEIHIPINKKGQMVVNWAGPWKDKETGKFDMMHYPYRMLKEFQEIEYLNYVMAEYKKLANLSFGGNIKATFKPAVASIKAGKKSIMGVAKKLLPMSMAESWIKQNPHGTAAEYKKLPPSFFNEIKNNNIIADAFLDSNRTENLGLDDLIASGSVSFKTGMADYKFTSVKQLQLDLEDAIKGSSDDGIKKALKKVRANLGLLKRNFLIISNLNRNNMIAEQRPMYFHFDPKKKRLAVGTDKNKRSLVPFEFTGKKLYYGLTAAGTSDLNPMPFDPRYPMVGLHANALNTILDNRIIHEISKGWIAVVIIGLGILLAFGVPALSPAMGGLATVGVVAGYTWLSFWLFANKFVWIDMVGPLTTMAIGYLGITVYNYIQEEKNKQFLKESFGTYVSPELIDQMYESGEEPSLGGEEGYHTAFFTDIQSFSAFSEKLTASELVALLNEFLTDMTDVLLENKGTLDKYIGDAIVAFYGAPIELSDHEYWSCISAIKMQESLDLLRKKWQEEGDRWPEIVHHMQNRIGISSGQMVTGNMGSASRMNYTMMGDNVNTAARLESSAKQYGIYIQIADSTFQSVKDRVVVRDLDLVKVIGKNEPVKVWELISEAGQEPEQYKKILPAYHEALNLYKGQEWEKAIEAFKASDALEDMFPFRKTNPSRIYIPRCEHFLTNPPNDDWDGVWTLTSK
ncbi:MAG: CHASE2 domain-containing protein [Fidelibacterota bacterium]